MPTDAGYQFAAWTVESPFPLRELPSSAAGADWRILCAPDAHRRRHASWYLRSRAADGQAWLWLGRDAGDDVLRFPGRAWCVIARGSGDVACTWHREVTGDMRAQMLVNHVLPLMASRAGYLVLHAAVVRRPGGGAVVIVGPTGAGKSTLAAYLGTQGWSILSDDRLIADRDRLAYPIAPVIRLIPEAASQLGLSAPLPEGHHKMRIRLGTAGAPEWADQPTAIERILCLRRSRETTTFGAGARETFANLVASQLQLGVDQREVAARTLATIGDLIAHTRCEYLTMAPGWHSLAEAATLLSDHSSQHE